MNDFKNSPHRRYNPLTSEWVLVSPQRTRRPWQGASEKEPKDLAPAYDPDCYLCPGNKRANGVVNPDYSKVHVFENDFPALLPETPVSGNNESDLFKAESVRGVSRVLCFSPRHNLTLTEMTTDEIRAVVDAWADQTAELGRRYQWVQVFENKGAMMGCSNPHPHCQIWAVDCIPNEPMKEDRSQKRHARDTGENLLVSYLAAELKQGERLVMENDHWAVVVPFWAVWPFETMLLPRRHVLRFPDLTETERNALADILKRHLGAYDRLFGVSFPYTMGWHGAPFVRGDIDHWQLHAHFYPPLLRSATVRKFMVGYEMLAEAQRDITAEAAAEHLRKMSID
jgi:UDPglucose--hexose-1-phosphate uridylyltransferase